MSELRITTAQSEDLEPSQRSELVVLCGDAFGAPFETTWDRVGPGLHVMGELAGRVVSWPFGQQCGSQLDDVLMIIRLERRGQGAKGYVITHCRMRVPRAKAAGTSDLPAITRRP